MSLSNVDYSSLLAILIEATSLTDKPYSEERWKMLIDSLDFRLSEDTRSTIEEHLLTIQNLKQKNDHYEFELKTLEIIQEINMKSSSLSEQNELLQNSVNNLRGISKADIVFVVLFQNGSDYYEIKSVSGTDRGELLNLTLPINHTGIINQVVEERKTVIVEDYRKDKQVTDPLVDVLIQSENIVSMMSSPLITNNNQLIGAICLARRYPYTSSDFLIKMLTYFCKQLAIALDNTRLYTNEQRITNLHEDIFEMALSDGYDGIMQKLCEFIDEPILLMDDLGNPIYKVAPQEIESAGHTVFYDDSAFYEQFNVTDYSFREHTTTINILDYRCTVFPIHVHLRVVGYLVIASEFVEEDHIDTIAIEQSKNIIALKIIQEETETRVELQLRQDYLLDLILGSESVEDLIRRGRHLKFVFNEYRKILVVDPNVASGGILQDDKETTEMLEHIRRLLQIKPYPLSVVYSQKLIVVIESDYAEENIRRLIDYFSTHYPECQPVIGVSNDLYTAESYTEGYIEGRKAVQFSEMFETKQQIIHYDDLGIIGMLFQESSFTSLEQFRDKYLGKLIEYDQQHDHELIKTLETYLNNESVIQTSAEQLYIHYNTLRNRVNRIEEILGKSLRDAQLKLNLRISLIIHRLLSSH